GVNAYSEKGNGCPPVIVEADGLRGGKVRIKGDISSQFLSGLLLVAPFARGETTIEVDGSLVSWPYIFMTLSMLRQFHYRIRQPSAADSLAEFALLTSDAREWGQALAEDLGPLTFHSRGQQYQTLDDYQRQAEAAAIEEGADPRRHVWLRDYLIEPD